MLEASLFVVGLLLANVLLHLLQVEPYRRNGGATRPEVLSGEVPLFAGKLPCDRDRALSFQESNDRGDRIFRRNLDAHVDVVPA